MSIAIEIKNLNKSYGDLQALNDINLEIKEGEFFGLLGPNGAGKTTLINIIAGLTHKDSGSVAVLGHDVVENYRLTKKCLGIVPQELVFDPYFSPKEALKLQSGYFNIDNNEARIDEVLKNLGLQDKADAYTRNLSGGMKRRLLIAKALVHDPEIIILDEPTAGVDVDLRNSLWEYIKQLNSQGKTIILTTHYLKEAEALCDRIAIMDKGHIIKIDTKENLINSIDKKVVELKLANDTSKLPSFFADYEYEFEANDKFTEVNLEMKKQKLPKFIEQVSQSQLEIKDLNISSAKLEDVFLKLTDLGGENN